MFLFNNYLTENNWFAIFISIFSLLSITFYIFISSFLQHFWRYFDCNFEGNWLETDKKQAKINLKTWLFACFLYSYSCFKLIILFISAFILSFSVSWKPILAKLGFNGLKLSIKKSLLISNLEKHLQLVFYFLNDVLKIRYN